MKNNNHNNNHIPNPFVPQHPAQPEFFADREKHLEEFRESVINAAKITPPIPLNYAILGSWGDGKTSLIYKFREIASKEFRDEVKTVCVYVALSPQVCRNWETFTENLLKEAEAIIENNTRLSERVKKEFKNWNVGLNLGIVSAQRTSSPKKLNLTNELQRFWEKVLKPSGVKLAFVMLDDIHYFPISRDDSAFLNLRATFQELVNRKCNYSLVVTAPSLLLPQIAEIAEPLLRFFRQLELSPFSDAEVRESIEVRLKAIHDSISVDDEVIQIITEKTKGQPYLVMFVMHELLKLTTKSHKITAEHLVEVWPSIVAELEKTVFSGRFQIASPNERDLLIAIAKKGEPLVSPIDFKNFSGATELFSRLERKELLVRKERGKYCLFHPLFMDFLKRQ